MMKPVIVTATRISESWLEVPLAINVLEQKDLRQGKGYGLDEILSGVPGVLAQSRYGSQDVRLTIRGFGARGAGARSNAGTSRGIRVLVDGFPETEPDGRTSFDLVDLSGAGSVEVVRSNASALWGNAAGGIVNVMSATDFDRSFVEAQSFFGSFGFQKNRVQAGALLGTGRFFFSANNSKFDGWRVHSSGSQFLVNTGIISSMGEDTRLGVYLTGTSNLFRIPGPLSQSQFDSLARQSDSLFIKRDERRVNRLGRLGVSLTHDLDASNTISASAFASPKSLQRSERNRFRDFNRYHVGGNLVFRNQGSFSPEIRNTLLAGGDEAYQDGAIHFFDLTPSGDRGTNLIANKREGANNLGAFVQDELMFGESFNLTLGARYDNITYFYDDFMTPSLNDGKSFTQVTPKLGATYRFSPSHSVYANVGGGVEVPAGNEVDPSPTFGQDTVKAINPLLEPISSTTVEVGTKQILSLGGDGAVATLAYDAALYWIEVRNDIIPYSGGAFYFTAGKSRRIGAEFGERLQFRAGISLEASLSLSRNTYGEYLVDSVHYGNPGKTANLADNKMAGIPEFFYSAAVRYAPPALNHLYLKAFLHGVGSYFADDANTTRVPSFGILDVSAGIDRLPFAENQFVLSGFVGVNNIADRKYAASAWINPDRVNGKPVFLEPGLPRSVVASVSVGWNF